MLLLCNGLRYLYLILEVSLDRLDHLSPRLDCLDDLDLQHGFLHYLNRWVDLGLDLDISLDLMVHWQYPHQLCEGLDLVLG